jgi:CRP-like cAMP-binding protein
MHRLGGSSHRMHLTLMQKWQRALKDADDWLADLNFGTAAQRVAALVRKMRHSLDSQYCTLFSREDMGAMLNLKLETVSREVSKLVHAGVIEVSNKAARIYFIRQPERLQEL